MSITLVVTAGPHKGHTYTFDRHDTFLVGRSEAANLSLPDDPYFSRMHFLVEVNPPLCRLSDLNSHNGTLVNGKKVQATDLRDGDEICCGQTTLRVAVAMAHDAATLDLPAGPLPSTVAKAARPGAATLDLPAASLPATVAKAVHHATDTLDEAELPSNYRSTNPPPLPDATARRAPFMTQSTPAQGLSSETGSYGNTGFVSGFPAVRGHRVVAELGRGGMGVVYRGVCEADGCDVAIKVIRPNGSPSPTAVGRFLRESAILKELRHPRIVGFRDSGLAGSVLYFVMDFVTGFDAAKLVQIEGPLETRRAVRLTLQLLEGLAFAHQKGYVHRDVKPANMLVTGSEPNETMRIADFGLARTYQESALSGLTLSGSAGGTPQFMPPEQVTDFRKVRPAADQYSAAASLYFLLSGRHSYEYSQINELFRKLLLEDPVPIDTRRPDLPPNLAAVIHRALQRNPEDRYPDVSAFAHALQPFA